ncbi:MAG: hypothetical protein ACRDPQ_03520 [Nocardioidaceae bacterium]
MTYSKLGSEFFDECADAGLSDAAVRTHAEAVTWIYRIERTDMRIKKHLVRRFAGSEGAEVAVKDLVAAGFWRDDGDAWVLEHHRDVVAQSLAAQVKHRHQERERMRRKRAKKRADVGTNVGATQTDSLSVSKDAPRGSENARDSDDPWASDGVA